MNSLPDEVLVIVFSNLAPPELDVASLVCNRWYTIIAQDGSWRDALKYRFNNVLPFRTIDLEKLDWYILNVQQLIHSNINIENETEPTFSILDTNTPVPNIIESIHTDVKQIVKSINLTSKDSEPKRNKHSRSKRDPNNKDDSGKVQKYKKIQQRQKSKLISGRSNWRIEYICRIELLKSWELGIQLYKAETEIGIGTIHDVFTNFKQNWSISVSLTHGVSVRTDLSENNFGTINDTKRDISFASTRFPIIQTVNSENIQTVENAILRMENIPDNNFSSTSFRMKTVKFFSVFMNSYYSTLPKISENTPITTDQAEKSKKTPKNIQNKDQQENIPFLAIVWGGFYDGRVAVQYMYGNTGRPKKHILCESHHWHNGKVLCLDFIPQIKLKKSQSKKFKKSNISDYIKSNVIVSGGSDGDIKFWDAETGSFLGKFTVQNQRSQITSIQNINSRYIIAGTNNGEIYIWDLEEENEPGSSNNTNSKTPITDSLSGPSAENRTSNTHTDPSSDEKDENIMYFERIGLKPLSLHTSDSYFTSKLPELDDNTIIGSSIVEIITDEKTESVLISSIYIYGSKGSDINSLHETHDTNGQPSSNSQDILFKGSLERFCVRTGKLLQQFSWNNQTPLSVIFWDNQKSTDPEKSKLEPRINLIIAGDMDGNIFYWDSNIVYKQSNYFDNTIEIIPPLKHIPGAHSTPIISIHYDGLKIITASKEGKVCIWEPMCGDLLRMIKCHGVGSQDYRNRPRYNHKVSTPLVFSNRFPLINGVHSRQSIQDFLVSRELSDLTQQDFIASEKREIEMIPSIPNFLLPTNFILSPSIQRFRSRYNSYLEMRTNDDISRYNPQYGSLVGKICSSYEKVVISSGPHISIFSTSSAVFASLGPLFGTKKKEFKNVLKHDTGNNNSESCSDFIQTNGPEENLTPYKTTNLVLPIGYKQSNLGPGRPKGTLKSTNKAGYGQSGSQETGQNKTYLDYSKKEQQTEIRNQLEKHQEISENERNARIQQHEDMQYMRKEYINPLEDLQLEDGDLMEYAKMMSLEEAKSSKDDVNYQSTSDEFVVEGLSEEEMIAYALFLSKNNQ
ncbi:hypothetical protein BB559_004688 [Furculomyces boomerangus]|uniref:F-box domain-containing protein n=1 Tax=Furculomyces boomerangus TaxID=61424 RepID=A0A2T9YDC5_9FUNG|nr:hypothetical protein BB559_004688 [Furculomyces boomerangus]